MKNSSPFARFIISVLFVMHAGLLAAQTSYTISGKLLDENKQPVMFAHVALMDSSGTSLITGTVSGETGKFELKCNMSGIYQLSARFVGYTPFQGKLVLSGKPQVDLGEITMASQAAMLSEVIIRHERLKAKQHVDKTTYYAHAAMKTAANTGVDMLQHIPGVQVGLLQNISLNGSQDVIILVNGSARDQAFLSQLAPEKIDRIEVQSPPGVEYSPEVSGVINVILKKDENTGVSGHFYANIPTAADEIFSFPTASLNYALDKLTLYTSYNGGFSYFDIVTEDKRVFSAASDMQEIIKKEHLYQENWSHKLHFGADYFLNDNTQLNVYGFISRFSNEQSGNFSLTEVPGTQENHTRAYQKDDHDINTSAFASVYYKHTFTENTVLDIDVNYYSLEAENRLRLSDSHSDATQVSRSQPNNKVFNARMDLHFPISRFLGAKVGLGHSLDMLGEEVMPGFGYSENTSAAYLMARYTKGNLQANTGIRAEYWQYGHNGPVKDQLAVLPALHIKYKGSGGRHLRFSYKQGIVRPHIFQLNPNEQALDFYTTQKGNPGLRPEREHILNLGYSRAFGNSFIKTSLFYKHIRNHIEPLAELHNGMFIKKEAQNLGDIQHAGLNTSGSLKLHKKLSLSPHLKLYYAQTQGNSLARAHHIANKQAINFASALSAVFMPKPSWVFSASLQYNSPLTRIQNDYREDALYFLSFEKTFFGQLKMGITSAIPFKKSFTYQGYAVSGHDFSQTTRDNIQMSPFPVWFKLSYSFAAGKKTRRIERDKSFKEKRLKKGF